LDISSADSGVFLPFLFANAVLGFASSVQSLWVRWDTFRKKQFSPAHAAFCFPILAHANAVQAYRSAIDAFSDLRPHSPAKIVLDMYWTLILIAGSIITVGITAKFFANLPDWTSVDVDNEVEPPAPNETIMSEIILAGESLRQNYVSPAVLQANEAGALVRLRDSEYGPTRYVRTRRVTALGFDPIMNFIELVSPSYFVFSVVV